MTVIYSTSQEAVQAAVMMSLQGHPWLNIHVIDMERVIVRESLMVCEQGLGTRLTTIYKDISGRYIGFADYIAGE